MLTRRCKVFVLFSKWEKLNKYHSSWPMLHGLLAKLYNWFITSYISPFSLWESMLQLIVFKGLGKMKYFAAFPALLSSIELINVLMIVKQKKTMPPIPRHCSTPIIINVAKHCAKRKLRKLMNNRRHYF